MKKDLDRDRCDRCKRWISTRHQTNLSTLEGLVSEGVDFNFCICGHCIDAVPASQWDKWVQQQAPIVFSNPDV